MKKALLVTLPKRAMLATLALLAALMLFSGLLVGCTAPADEKTADSDTTTSSTTAAAEGENIPLTVGYWGGTCEMALYVAQEYGFFEDAGLDVNFKQITTETPILLANNELDAFLATPTDIKPMEQDINLTIIDSLHTGCFQGATTADSGITSAADLEGRTVGVDLIGSVAYIQLSSEMTRMGYDPTKVNWKVYNPPLLEQALDNGEIEAFATGDPWVPIALKNGKVRFYSNTYDDYLKDTICCFVGMNTNTLDNNPEAGRRLSAAFKEACAYINAHAEEVTKMAIDKAYISADDVELCTELVESYHFLAGDEDIFWASVKEHVMENVRAGSLPDAPTDPTELDTWTDNLAHKVANYMGD
jgi:NitT/TauT family transport system substrate-binding protein